MEDGGPARLEIGATLKQTRQRQGLEISEIEQRTKIRIKYLRALENEEWDVLPGPAYVRGFLKAYAEILELDGEVLADEYRRRHEEQEPQAAQGVLVSERSRGRQEGGAELRPRPIQLLVGIAAIAIIVLIVVLIATGSGDGSGPEEGSSDEPPAAEPVPSGEVRLAIAADSTLRVCAVNAAGEVLIDGQFLPAGTREKLGRDARFSVDLGEGEARLIVDGEPSTLALNDPASYEITAAGIESLPFSGPGCP
ncbi:MAG: helix-turn-helix domain-containing protein [Solirubrobacterales bacterium]